MEGLLATLAIPAALSATKVVVQGVQSVAQSFAGVLQSVIESQPADVEQADGSNPPGFELADFRAHAETLKSGIEQRLRERLSDIGVDADSKISLRLNSDGSVEVEGDDPRKVAVEAVFAADEELSNDFRQLAAIQQLLQAAEEHQEFAEAYGEDPVQAVNAYRYLLDDQEETVLQLFTDQADEQAGIESLVF